MTTTTAGRGGRADGSARPARNVVLVPAPDLPKAIGRELADELPARLGGEGWQVGVDDRELLAEDLGDLAEAAHAARERTGAEVAVCLTDVPLRTGRRPVVAALDARQGIAVVSVPAAGAVGLRRSVKRATEAVVAELAGAAARPPAAALRGQPVELPDGHELRRGYVLGAGLGHLRLLAGMVRANRPWRAFSTLSSAVVAALATGAYSMINTTVWQLSGALSPVRLLVAMLLALAAVVAWLVVAHDLWEGDRRPAKERHLYNAATLLTLTTAVAWAYVVLFAVLLGVAGLLVDSGVMHSNTQQPAHLGEYLRLAWLGASIATVAGGLGSGLESLDDVRDAAYGHDQRRRGTS